MAKKQHEVGDISVDAVGDGYRPRFRARWLLPDYWPTWAMLAAVTIAAFVPRTVAGLLGRGLGEMFYRTSTKRRRIAAINLGLAFPDLAPDVRSRILRRHFHIYGECLLDMGLLWWRSPTFLDRYFQIEGLEHYRAARAAGRNVILLTGHFAALDLAGPVISRRYPQVGLIKPIHNRLADYFVARGRLRFASRLYLRDKGLRPVVKAVRAGFGFYYLPDEDFGPDRSVFVPFLGTVAATITALSRLATLTDALVLPTSAIRVSNRQGYRIVIRPALTDFPGDDPEQDARRMNQVLGEMIAGAPEQYMWTFKYFRSRPNNEPSPYDR
jgi:lipid A biosynthesis lauroyl/palmitoleoyl acyltransferase